MTAERQSQVNTTLLGAVLGVSGFIAVNVWNLHGSSEKSFAQIEEHTRQITEIRTDVARIQLQATSLNLKIVKWESNRTRKREQEDDEP